MPKVVHQSANTQGRDFIVGDVHGCRTELERLLERVSFAPGQGDRLFGVGDLTDRGPDPMGCLALLDEPWFFPVLGNHEQLLLDALSTPFGEDNIALQVLVANGGEWLFDALHRHGERLSAYAEKIRDLPWVRVVGADSEHRFNVVHALLLKRPDPPVLYSDAEIDAVFPDADEHLRERLLWSRGVAFDAGLQSLYEWWQNPPRAGGTNLSETDRAWLNSQVEPMLEWQHYPGLSLTYCGHTPLPHPTILVSHCFLDTGSGYSGTVQVGGYDSGFPKRLTLAEHTPTGPLFTTYWP